MRISCYDFLFFSDMFLYCSELVIIKSNSIFIGNWYLVYMELLLYLMILLSILEDFFCFV